MQCVRIAGWLILGLGLFVQVGCSRAYWRQNADSEAYGLILEKTRIDGRWSVPRTDVIPSPLSRMYDPVHPDFGAMPPDDPAAHQYMQQMSDCNRIQGSDYWDSIGMTNSIENPAWIASLPAPGDDGVPVASQTPSPVAPASKPVPFLKRLALVESWDNSKFAKWFHSPFTRHDPKTEIAALQAGHEARGGGLSAVFDEDPSTGRAIKAKPVPVIPQVAAADALRNASGSEQAEVSKQNAVTQVAYQESLPTPDSEPRELPPVPEQLVPEPLVPEASAQTETEGEPADDNAEDEDTADEEATESAQTINEPDLSAANPALPPVETLTLEEAIALSYLHGREYQTAIEDLYLAALDLAFDRFQFDVRFLGIGGGRPNGDLGYSGTPDGAQSLTGTARFGMSRLLPAGGQWAVELANQTLWLFSDGPNESGTASTLTFSFVQPLLFAAGRKVVLEDLTQSERNVLYAARDLARFRQEFFVSSVTGSGGSGGYLGLLQAIQQISNQEDNIRRLRYQLEVSEANELNTDALSRTQLESTLLRNLNSIRNSRRTLQDRLDAFKIQLGLPPDVAMSLDTTFLAPFQLIEDDLFTLEAAVQDDFLEHWETFTRDSATPEQLQVALDILEATSTQIESSMSLIDEDFERVEANLPQRLAGLPEPVDENAAQVEDNRKLDESYYQNAKEQLRQNTARIATLREQIGTSIDAEALRFAYTDVYTTYDNLLRVARNLQGIQIGLRTELISLNPFHMPMEMSVGYALTNRVDLMNQRANVTDSRRRVEVAANQLQTVLDVRVEQDVSTRPILNNDNPVDFRRTEGTFRAGVSFVAPLDQIAQRNEYRVSQILYQRSRRNYMLAEDQVKFDVRQSWRQLQVLKQNFEVARYALRVAAQQYDQAVEEISNPDQQSGRGAGQAGLNTINALNSVLSAQNDLIGIWVDYESARLNLYRDMGIMEIDPRGLWVEPFYQNGMTLPTEVTTGPPGWSNSSDQTPDEFGKPEETILVPPVPSANSGVIIKGDTEISSP